MAVYKTTKVGTSQSGDTLLHGGNDDMKKPTALEYLKKCMDECSDKLSNPSFFTGNDLQKSSQRVEVLRDTRPRCGLKMPEQWDESVKVRGWGMWTYSGGTVEEFGHCDYSKCPRHKEFIRSSPWKDIRALIQQE